MWVCAKYLKKPLREELLGVTGLKKKASLCLKCQGLSLYMVMEVTLVV